MTTKFSAIFTMFLIISNGSAFGSGGHDDAHAGKSAAQALTDLMSGNKRFVENSKYAESRKKLTSSQSPSAIFLSCSDSRVSPELAFDQGLGDVFVIRTAGHVIGAAQMASIEYAVSHLGTKLIVVMGHESCGAVKAALSTPKGQTIGSADLDELVKTIRANMSEQYSRNLASLPKEDPTVSGPVKANVNGTVASLTKRSKIIEQAVKTGGLQIVPAIYELASGKVEFWDMGAKHEKPTTPVANKPDHAAHGHH